jgi:hypothetical protein
MTRMRLLLFLGLLVGSMVLAGCCGWDPCRPLPDPCCNPCGCNPCDPCGGAMMPATQPAMPAGEDAGTGGGSASCGGGKACG